MTITVHIVNTPRDGTREAHEDSWRLLDEQGAHHPPGRVSHTAWLVDDVLHVLNMKLAEPPQVGELLNIVRSKRSFKGGT